MINLRKARDQLLDAPLHALEEGSALQELDEALIKFSECRSFIQSKCGTDVDQMSSMINPRKARDQLLDAPLHARTDRHLRKLHEVGDEASWSFRSVGPSSSLVMAVMACLEELLSDGGSQLRIDRRPPHELVRRLKLGGSTLVVDEDRRGQRIGEHSLAVKACLRPGLLWRSKAAFVLATGAHLLLEAPRLLSGALLPPRHDSATGEGTNMLAKMLANSK